MPAPKELDDRMARHEPGPANDENLHGRPHAETSLESSLEVALGPSEVGPADGHKAISASRAIREACVCPQSS